MSLTNRLETPLKRVGSPFGCKPRPLTTSGSLAALLCALMALSGCGAGSAPGGANETATPPTSNATPSKGDDPPAPDPVATPTSEGALKFLLDHVAANPGLKLKDVRYAEQPAQWPSATRFVNQWKVAGEVPFSELDTNTIALNDKGFTFANTEKGRAGFVYLKRPIKTKDGGEIGELPMIEWSSTSKAYEVKNLAGSAANPPADPKPTTESPAKAVDVDVATLSAAYSDNPASAQRKYGSKLVNLRGYVSGTQTDATLANPLVYLMDDSHEHQVAVELPQRDKTQLDMFERLAQDFVMVVMVGTVAGRVDGQVQIKDGKLVEPTRESIMQRVEGLLAKADVSALLEAESYTALMQSLNLLPETDAQALAPKVAKVRQSLAKAAEQRWAPVVREQAGKRDFKAAQESLKKATAELLDEASAKALQLEIDEARKQYEAAIAALVSKVRSSVVSGEHEAASKVVKDAQTAGELDDDTAQALALEIATAVSIRQQIAADKPKAAALALRNAEGLSADVRKKLQEEVDAAVADFERRVAEAISNIRQLIVKDSRKDIDTAIKGASDGGLLDKKTREALELEAQVAASVRDRAKAENILGAKEGLNWDGFSPEVKAALESEVSAAHKALEDAAKKTAVVKVKLKDGTEWTLDFSAVASTTKVEKVEITAEDSSGFVQMVYFKVSFKHFAAKQYQEPTIKADAMGSDVEVVLGETGTAAFKLDKSQVKNKKVLFERK